MSETREDELDTSVATEPSAEAEKTKLDLNVEISDAGPCKKHLKVAIAGTEIERQYKESLGSIRRDAAVPGFRPGRAPETLVSKRFRKEVQGQVKSTLLMAALEQIDEDYKINPISQPNLDLEAIVLPDNGPLEFEMDVEVQPDFPLPTYKALSVNRPVRTITEADIDAQLKSFLERYAQLVPKLEGGAELGDQITADLKFHKDGVDLNEVREIQFRLQPELRFQDGRVADLAGALLGAKPGDVRDADAEVGSASADPALRGQTIRVSFTVHDLKTYRLPTVDPEFLDSIGFDSIEELREALGEVLERRIQFQQRQAIRRQLLDAMIAEAPFELPKDLVARQERSTLRSQVQELRQAGLSDTQIRAREAEIRANSHESTLRSLKEFFLLAKIAEAEDLKVEDEDLESEITAIASRTDESPRRVRARIEKEGLAEGLASQILERKTIDRILEYVKIVDVAQTEDEKQVETVDQLASPQAPEGEADPESSETPTADA